MYFESLGIIFITVFVLLFNFGNADCGSCVTSGSCSPYYLRAIPYSTWNRSSGGELKAGSSIVDEHEWKVISTRCWLISLAVDGLWKLIKACFRYPDFIESRLGDGLQMSFVFIQATSGFYPGNSNPKVLTKAPGNLKGKSDGSSFAYARLGVSRIYKLIRSNRVSRNKFMSSIVRKFETPSWNHSVIPFLMWVLFFLIVVL